MSSSLRPRGCRSCRRRSRCGRAGLLEPAAVLVELPRAMTASKSVPPQTTGTSERAVELDLLLQVLSDVARAPTELHDVDVVARGRRGLRPAAPGALSMTWVRPLLRGFGGRAGGSRKPLKPGIQVLQSLLRRLLDVVEERRAVGVDATVSGPKSLTRNFQRHSGMSSSQATSSISSICVVSSAARRRSRSRPCRASSWARSPRREGRLPADRARRSRARAAP